MMGLSFENIGSDLRGWICVGLAIWSFADWLTDNIYWIVHGKVPKSTSWWPSGSHSVWLMATLVTIALAWMSP